MPEQITFYQLTMEEFKTVVSEAVENGIKMYLSKSQITTKDDEFITRKEAATILKVSLPTLLEWTKKGIVNGYRISSRIRYKKSELESALGEISSLKQKHQSKPVVLFPPSMLNKIRKLELRKQTLMIVLDSKISEKEKKELRLELEAVTNTLKHLEDNFRRIMK